MLDDLSVIKQKDPSDALGVADQEFNQVSFAVSIENPDNDAREINNVVVTGMGGSALAAMVVKTWLKDSLKVPFDVCRSYDLPSYVSSNSLVIASSYSGNTEETLSALDQALGADAQVAIIAAGGQLVDIARSKNIAHVVLPGSFQPRMAVNFNLKALVAILINFGLLPSSVLDEVNSTVEWLETESRGWLASVPTEHNYAKQIAMKAVGKTPIFYGGTLTAPVAYKFKISWNENAKNVAFWNELPEFNHNEFMGWVSHPIEKPFAVFDLVSSFEHPRILKRFELTDRLLSGVRPKSTVIELRGDTPLKQMLWGGILADFASIYVAILNGIDPTAVDLIENFKVEMTK